MSDSFSLMSWVK